MVLGGVSHGDVGIERSAGGRVGQAVAPGAEASGFVTESKGGRFMHDSALIGDLSFAWVGRRPVLSDQSGYSSKSLVVCNQGQAVGNRNGGDQQIVCPDHLTAGLQRIADRRVFSSCGIIEWQGAKWAEHAFDPGDALIASLILPGSVQQFRPHYRADNNLAHGNLTQSNFYRRGDGFQLVNPRVRVQEVTHHHGSRVSGDRSAGTSRGSSAKLPAVASK